MSSSLDMSLDDLIKNNKKSGSGSSRPRGRGTGGSGPFRRPQNRTANRATPYAPAKAPETSWQHDIYSNPGAGVGFPGQVGRASAIETGTKLYISNLEYGVSNEDIKELFAEVGDIKRYSIHYDRSGRSKGTAEVVFSRRVDAIAAVKRYNNVQLDGKPMQIEIVGTNIVTPGVAPPPAAPVIGAFGSSNVAPRGGQGRGIGATGRPHGGSSSGRGRRPGQGGGRGRGGRGEKISAEDLDADLEKYHSEAMQTN
ncbi:hypothetical protein SAY87_013208 [Trapa incisa]|uniref:RRM domain-containing protein n=1 Tax=Trapa incisa TaxID=236973 RepID=A0AAN7KAN7_9MYRT|nr:hypothetical protein SAY87_013208 [Trapa incisa]